MTLSEIETIKVDGVDYSLKIIDPTTQLSVSDSANVSRSEQVIKLLSYAEKYNVQSLMHELLHIIDGNRMGDVLTETQIEALATGICQIMFDNADLVLAIYWAAVGELISFDEDDEAEDEEDGDEDADD